MKVKEIFYSLQGEGFHVGTPALFVRFSGCNLWDGRESSKMRSPCYFCDTDFVGGESLSEADLISRIEAEYRINKFKLLVFTGGEPTLQLTKGLVEKLDSIFPECLICLETNGENFVDYGGKIWITMSPKTDNFRRKVCDELKLIYPNNLNPDLLTTISASHKFIQPMDYSEDNKKLSAKFCLDNPEWRLSLQTHKIIGLQ